MNDKMLKFQTILFTSVFAVFQCNRLSRFFYN
jgi:hypothetical protein